MSRTRKQTLIIGLSVAAVLFGPGLFHLASLSWKQQCLERKQRELEAARRQLAAEHARLTSDPVYVEGLIRSTFKVAKPGELVVPLETNESSTKTR